MKKIRTSLFLLLLVGLILITVGYFKGPAYSLTWNNNRLVPIEYVTETQKVAAFKNIAIDVKDAEVEIISGDVAGVTLTHNKEAKMVVTSTDNRLEVKGKEGVSNVQIGLTSSYPKVTITVPKNSKLDQLAITNRSGDVKVEQQDAKEITLDLKSGDVNFSDVNVAGDLKIQQKYGDLQLDQVNSKILAVLNNAGDTKITKSKFEKFEFEGNYGDINVKASKFNQSTIKNASGDISLTDNDMFGENIIINRYGDIKIKSPSTLAVKVITKYGDSYLNGNEINSNYHTQTKQTENSLSIESNSGDVAIDVRESR